MAKRTVRTYEVCIDLTFMSDYAYVIVEAEDEEDAISKITDADAEQGAAECSPEIDMWNAYSADLHDEYEVDEEEDDGTES